MGMGRRLWGVSKDGGVGEWGNGATYEAPL